MSLADDNSKRPKPQNTHLGVSNIYAFSRNILHKTLGGGESAAGFTYLSLRIHLKS